MNMLDTLRRIVQEVNSSKSLGQALEVIVSRVRQTMAGCLFGLPA